MSRNRGSPRDGGAFIVGWKSGKEDPGWG